MIIIMMMMIIIIIIIIVIIIIITIIIMIMIIIIIIMMMVIIIIIIIIIITSIERRTQVCMETDLSCSQETYHQKLSVDPRATSTCRVFPPLPRRALGLCPACWASR